MISVIHPSRGRAEQAYFTYTNWTGNQETEYIKYYVSIEPDQYKAYEKYFDEDILIVTENKSAIDAVNNAAEKISKSDRHNTHIFIVNSDDFTSFKGWDNTVLNAVQGKEDFVLKTFDGDQPWIVTLPILDFKFYSRFGYIYHPGYKHLFADTDLTTVAQYIGKLIIRNDIMFKQNFIDDAQHKISNDSWEQGEKLYLKRYKEDFGVKKEFEISHLPHLKWVKHRL